MGIFEDEMKKMKKDAALKAHSVERERGELNEVARNLCDELTRFIAQYPQHDKIEMSVEENRLTLSKKAPKRDFVITCERGGRFRATETTSFPTRVGDPRPSNDRDQMTRADMARKTIAWLGLAPGG